MNSAYNLRSCSAILSLKNHGVDEEVKQMFEMGAETMNLPMDEKMKFEQGDDGQSFGSVAIYNLLSNRDLALMCRVFPQIQTCGRQRRECKRPERYFRIHQYC